MVDTRFTCSARQFRVKRKTKKLTNFVKKKNLPDCFPLWLLRGRYTGNYTLGQRSFTVEIIGVGEPDFPVPGTSAESPAAAHDQPQEQPQIPVDWDENKELALILSYDQKLDTPFRPVDLSDVNAFFNSKESQQYLDPSSSKSKGKRTNKLQVKQSKAREAAPLGISKPELMTSLELRRITSDRAYCQPTMVPRSPEQPPLDNAIEATSSSTQHSEPNIPEREDEGMLPPRLRMYDPNRQMCKRSRPTAVMPYPVPTTKHSLEQSTERLRQIYERDRVTSLDCYDQAQGPSGFCEGSEDPVQALRCLGPYNPAGLLSYLGIDSDRGRSPDSALHASDPRYQSPSGACIPPPAGLYDPEPSAMQQPDSSDPSVVGIDLSKNSEDYPFKLHYDDSDEFDES